jgi:hypothetical protein
MFEYIVERIFGVYKSCFQIFPNASDFALNTEVKPVYTTTTFYSFNSLSQDININNELDSLETVDVNANFLSTGTEKEEFTTTSAFCVDIAQKMWDDYLNYSS